MLRWIDKSKNKTVTYDDYEFMRNMNPFDSLAFLSPYYHSFVRGYFFQEVQDSFTKAIPDYYNLSYNEKKEARDKLSKVSSPERKIVQKDSLEIFNWTHTLKSVKQKFPSKIAELYAFINVSIDAYLISSIDQDAMHKVYFYFSEFDNESYKSAIAAYLKNKTVPFSVGDEVQFNLIDKITNHFELADYKGQVVLLSFWFPGCTPCFKEFPFEKQLLEELGEINFQILNICLIDINKFDIKLLDKFEIPGIIRRKQTYTWNFC